MPDLKSHQALFDVERSSILSKMFKSPPESPLPLDIADLERRVRDLEDRARREDKAIQSQRRLESLGFEFPQKETIGLL